MSNFDIGKCQAKRIEIRTATRLTGTSLAYVALTVGMFLPANAQEVLPLPSASAPNEDATKPPARRVENDVAAMEEAMRQLRAERRQLAARFQANEKSTTHRDSSRSRTAIDVKDVRDRIEQARQLDLQRSERIKEKLDRLRGFVEQGKVCLPDAPKADKGTSEAAVPSASPMPASSDAPASASPEPSQANATAPTAARPAEAPVDTVPVNTLGSRFPELPAIQRTDGDVEAMPLLDGAVDRLRLANNLYGSHEIKLALDVYQRLDKSALAPLDQLWVEYQIGNCHRRLGNRQESERSFRIVTSRDKASWIGENARWWLDVADRASRLESQVLSLKQALDEIQEQPNANRITP